MPPHYESLIYREKNAPLFISIGLLSDGWNCFILTAPVLAVYIMNLFTGIIRHRNTGKPEHPAIPFEQ
jgi:hypothetical protein